MKRLLTSLVLVAVQAATPAAGPLVADRAALEQLISAVSLDVMTEASVEACSDIGAPSAAQARAAWTAGASATRWHRCAWC